MTAKMYEPNSETVGVMKNKTRLGEGFYKYGFPHYQNRARRLSSRNRLGYRVSFHNITGAMLSRGPAAGAKESRFEDRLSIA
jgi:hypothetical protein